MFSKFIILIISFFLLFNQIATAQSVDYNFRHLDATQGLADGVAEAIGQDKYGYIWVGTMSGLSRFNGYTVQSFYNDIKDSNSLPASVVQSILCDSRGELWIGCYRGLVRYDYASSKFLPVAAMKDKEVIKMIEQTPHNIFIATDAGLAMFNPVTLDVQFCKNNNDVLISKLLGRAVHDMFLGNNRLYLGTDTGLLVYNTLKKDVRKIKVPGSYNVKLVAEDGSGNVWFTSGNGTSILYKTDTTFKNFTSYERFDNSFKNVKDKRIFSFLIDNKKELWFTTGAKGLVKYDYKTERFYSYKNDPLKPSSISANHVTHLFQGKHGFIWVGTEGNGVDYFHPDKNLFQVILPGDDIIKRLTGLWARAFITDDKNNHWMGMSDGLIRMNPLHENKLFQNIEGGKPQLHYNSIRSLLQDKEGAIWIGTASGVNRFHPETGKMDFLNAKDSLPKEFYWAIFEDSHNNVWFGSQNNFYYRNAGERNIHSIAAHPYLSFLINKGVRSIYEDKKHCLWFGMNGSGLVMFKPEDKTVKHWMRSEKEDNTLINNTITSIAEDSAGVMWFSSFTGLTYYDPLKDKFGSFTQKNGLTSVKTSALMVDGLNRLWIGSTRGLLMLDSSRKIFKNFDFQDGLLTMEFTDMPAYKAPDGTFIYPTMKGFLNFNPLNYKEDVKDVSVYLTGMQIPRGRYVPEVNYEELKTIKLAYYQNFFSLDLTAFNYSNPEQTWYAYKLEGFDKDWVYTKNKLLNYTNVPGGDYVFKYKATSDPANWNVPERLLTIEIATVFYETSWFWIIVILLILTVLYMVYYNRLQQQRKIFSLQNKAQTLEKEKAIAMFENLKQQLNPHFLFNSLTSLGSLIRIDQKMAGEFLEGMSKIYRYILKNRNNELVTLAEEIAFAGNYIKLQLTRFEYGLQVNLNIPEEYHYFKIAPVTIQNLIENAIKHNCIDDENILTIDFFIETDYVVARNNLQKKRIVDTSNKQGLKNLQSLYHYLSTLPVVITDDDNYFTVKIPLL